MSGSRPFGASIKAEAQFALNDIRAKFEEAFFGRQVTPQPRYEFGQGLEKDMSDSARLEELWGKARHEQEPEPDIEIER